MDINSVNSSQLKKHWKIRLLRKNGQNLAFLTFLDFKYSYLPWKKQTKTVIEKLFTVKVVIGSRVPIEHVYYTLKRLAKFGKINIWLFQTGLLKANGAC